MNFTKRDIILGNQCLKAIWLSKHRPELAAAPDPGSLLRFEQGNTVDEVARSQVYDGGELIEALEWQEACVQTQALLEAGVQRLYQPAFEAEGVRIRVDILDVLPGQSVVLREVKMSTRIKDEHLLDIATQVFVIEKNGYSVKGAYLVAINNAHTPENDIPLFHEFEITQDVQDIAGQLAPDVSDLTGVADAALEPDIRIGKHCTKPKPCVFQEYCWEDVPKDSIFSIPRLSPKKLEILQDQEILHLRDLPPAFDLTDKQWAYVHFQTSGTQSVNKTAIQNELRSFVYPLYFLDFETHNNPIPSYPHTYPYQQVPFQFSLHVLHEDQTLSHHDYLHTESSDPREHVTRHLIEAIGQSGTVLVYNAGFEIKVLKELAAVLPGYSEALDRVIGRVYDQLPLIRKNVKDPLLHRSYSLKTITRVLLNDDTYSTLDIANGEAAHAEWVRLHRLTDETARQQIIDHLKAYCCQDTLAQVNLHYWCEQQIS